MRLEFGKPKTALQAVIRLPDRSDPEYVVDGGPTEHVVHFKEALLTMVVNIMDGKKLNLEDRWIPMETQDMIMLRKLSSFTLNPEPVLEIEWGALGNESEWALENWFPSGDDSYAWWRISQITPGFDVPGYELICVETNNHFDVQTRYYHPPTFDIFVLTPEELESLKSDLTNPNKKV